MVCELAGQAEVDDEYPALFRACGSHQQRSTPERRKPRMVLAAGDRTVTDCEVGGLDVAVNVAVQAERLSMRAP
jgi:hypothetical protein